MEDRRGRGLVTCGKGVGLNCFYFMPFLLCRWSVDIKESVWGVGVGLDGDFSMCEFGFVPTRKRGYSKTGAFRQGSTA